MNATILIALLFVGFIFLFIFFIKWVSRRSAKRDAVKLMHDFDKLAGNKEALPDHQEILHKRIIGIDKKKGKLLFIDRTRAEEQVIVLNTSELKATSIIKNKNQLSRLTGSIFIGCEFRNPVMHPVILTLYDEYYDDVDSLERMEKKAVQWNQIINSHMEKAR